MSEYNAVVGVYHSLGRQEGMPKTPICVVAIDAPV
jgi:hypothetical protein